MNPKISIIVPVYNTEEFLIECLDSISAQTYKNFEAILVDDGSSDKSGEICDLYANKDERFKVVHKLNAGVSAARNTALDLVKGEYICFVDSDDTIESEMLASFLKLITDYNADIVFSDREISNTLSKIKSPVCFNQQDARINFFQTHLLQPSLWLCIFKTKLFEKLKFPPHIVHYEDFAIMACLLSRSNRIVLTGVRFYHYRMRIGSATHKTINKNTMTCFEIDKFLSDHNVYINKQEKIDVNSFFLQFACLVSLKDIKSHYTSIIRRKLFYNLKTILLSKSLNSKVKLLLLIYVLSPHLAKYLNNIYISLINVQ